MENFEKPKQEVKTAYERDKELLSLENNFELFKEDLHYDKFINNISQHIENEEFEQVELLSERYFKKLFLQGYGFREYGGIKDTIKKINQRLIENNKGFVIHPDLYDTLSNFITNKYHGLYGYKMEEPGLSYSDKYLNRVLEEIDILLKKNALRYVNLISIDKPHTVRQEDVIVDNFSESEETTEKSLRTLSGGYYAKNSKILGINSLIDRKFEGLSYEQYNRQIVKRDVSISKWKNTIWHEIGHSFHVWGHKETELNFSIKKFFELSKQNKSIKDCVGYRGVEDSEEDFAEIFSYYQNTSNSKKKKSDIFNKKIEVMREIFSIIKL